MRGCGSYPEAAVNDPSLLNVVEGELLLAFGYPEALLIPAGKERPRKRFHFNHALPNTSHKQGVYTGTVCLGFNGHHVRITVLEHPISRNEIDTQLDFISEQDIMWL